MAHQNAYVYCPPVEIGQFVYLRHRPAGRNKIQDAWSSKVYKVIDVQGTTHTVVPVNGGAIRRIHRSNLRACVGPIPLPRQDHQTVTITHEPEADLDSESQSTDSEPEYLMVEHIDEPVGPRLEDSGSHLERIGVKLKVSKCLT